MRITMTALGSQGDVLPCVTLGAALQAAGHRVLLATFENFKSLVTAPGLEFSHIRGDIQTMLNGSGGQALADSGRSPLRMARSVLQLFGTMANDFAHDFSAPSLRDADLIINQLPGGMFGCDLAEASGVPMMTAAVLPMTPSRHAPMLVFPRAFSFVPGYNAFTHWLAYQLVWQVFRPAVSRWRRETLGLSRAPLWGYTRRMATQATPVLNGFSAHLVPRPADWGDNVHITGYWFSEDDDWQPPDDLLRFIEAGPPPVFVGFGSMPVRDPEQTTQIVLDALRLSGQRGILHAGWAGIGRRDLPDHVHWIDYAPYGWLFPRMTAVVHHGGSGTTAYAARSGVPSLIVPFLFDQFYWGGRMAALGAGPPAIPFKRLSAGRLAEAIGVMVGDAEMQRRAAELGRRVRGEGGVAAAVDLVERYAGVQ